MISKILLIFLIFVILLIMCVSLNVLQMESFSDAGPPELKSWMGIRDNNTPKQKVLGDLSQRVTGVPLPSSYEPSEPVFITGLGEKSKRLVGASKTVYGNNGSVSCTKYCGGTNFGPWNGELPGDWFGAKCIKTSNPKYTCDMKPQGSIQCTCAPSGTGWNS
jgi:hypothetical protein